MATTSTGWDINETGAGEWMPWGPEGNARARVLASADGYSIVLVEAEAGYVGTPHEHTNTELGYVLDGEVRNQGQVVTAGGAFAAERGSLHSDFEALGPSRYLTIFKL